MKSQNLIHPASWLSAPVDTSKNSWPLVGWLEVRGNGAPAPGLEALLESRWPAPRRETVISDRSNRIVAIFSPLT